MVNWLKFFRNKGMPTQWRPTSTTKSKNIHKLFRSSSWFLVIKKLILICQDQILWTAENVSENNLLKTWWMILKIMNWEGNPQKQLTTNTKSINSLKDVPFDIFSVKNWWRNSWKIQQLAFWTSLRCQKRMLDPNPRQRC